MSAKTVLVPESTADEPTAKVEIKVPALLAGTVTSVIVAVLASRLGVQGTLIGAAFTSLVFGLISPFLTFGLQRTHEGLKLVAARRPWRRGFESDAAGAPLAPGGPQTEVLAAVEVTTTRRRRVPLGVAIAGAVITALVTFGSTVGVVTALEAAAGRSVDGSYATTVQGVTRPEATIPASDASSLDVPSTATPSASPSPTASPTEAATPAPVATPTPAATEAVPTTATTPTAAPAADTSQATE